MYLAVYWKLRWRYGYMNVWMCITAGTPKLNHFWHDTNNTATQPCPSLVVMTNSEMLNFRTWYEREILREWKLGWGNKQKQNPVLSPCIKCHNQAFPNHENTSPAQSAYTSLSFFSAGPVLGSDGVHDPKTGSQTPSTHLSPKAPHVNRGYHWNVTLLINRDDLGW